VPAARRISAIELDAIHRAVAAHYGLDPQSFGNLRAESISRDVAAWLSRQLTSSTLRELAAVFGLGHAHSVRNLTRRVDRALPDCSKLRQDIARIRQEFLKSDQI
jgi:chromosomal replication initiation ATPase DnaA